MLMSLNYAREITTSCRNILYTKSNKNPCLLRLKSWDAASAFPSTMLRISITIPRNLRRKEIPRNVVKGSEILFSHSQLIKSWNLFIFRLQVCSIWLCRNPLWYADIYGTRLYTCTNYLVILERKTHLGSCWWVKTKRFSISLHARQFFTFQ